jgi:hypothetical protein
MSILRRIILACAAALLPGMASAADVRIMWYSDGNEGEVVRDLLDRFEKQNPDIRVILDRVPYKTIVENLPTMVASGQAPDMARITDLGGQAEYLLDVGPLVKDRSYWEANFSDTLPWMRPAGNANGIFGMLTQLTITLPIINETLFQQAGIQQVFRLAAEIGDAGHVRRLAAGDHGREVLDDGLVGHAVQDDADIRVLLLESVEQVAHHLALVAVGIPHDPHIRSRGHAGQEGGRAGQDDAPQDAHARSSLTLQFQPS